MTGLFQSKRYDAITHPISKFYTDAKAGTLPNVTFVAPRPKEQMPDFWSICDVALIHLKNEPTFAEVIPSKMFEAMAMGKPILQAASQLMGYVSFFENFVQIFVLLVAWLIVLVAFFILAIQLFVTLIEFKLTTLAGFVLVPFGLFGRTAFLAERVLGNVVASGVKVLVLAVIVGIGTTLFGEFTQGFGGNQPSIDDVLALVLAALSLLGLGIFGPGIATGLTAGAPQLGAGAAVGTAFAAGGLGVAGAATLRATAGALAGAARGVSSVISGRAFRPTPAVVVLAAAPVARPPGHGGCAASKR